MEKGETVIIPICTFHSTLAAVSLLHDAGYKCINQNVADDYAKQAEHSSCLEYGDTPLYVTRMSLSNIELELLNRCL